MISEHLSEFHGLRVHPVGQPADAASVAWRVWGDPSFEDEEESFPDCFQQLLDTVDCSRVRAIVVGTWGWAHDDDHADVPVRLLASSADRLPALEAIFLGDYVSEESEISWIGQSDITPLLTAYPRLKRLDVRGGVGLELQPVTHTTLETLRFETGGLPAHVIRAVGAGDLPALRHLEMWLGTVHYGGDSGPADWADILDGSRLPALTHLGLQNSERQDEVAAAIASAPVVARLETLDLSMGTFGDEGAEALLAGQPLTHLKRLNLDNQYMSEEMLGRLLEALPGVEVPHKAGETYGGSPGERYIEVSE
ncbi:STM4015 family protein [Nonomuraea sp. NPDC050663]|uniref:STM4015 family protein n=1 Tax=Nonomuraea sp. NPDC050663 TaxID=3364370 RepID=UPI0037BCE247